MKVLTAAQMREVDRLTIERGIPGVVLMENAGQRVVEFLATRFAPLSTQRITVICGKGNNGGDGMVVARQLFRPQLRASRMRGSFSRAFVRAPWTWSLSPILLSCRATLRRIFAC